MAKKTTKKSGKSLDAQKEKTESKAKFFKGA